MYEMSDLMLTNGGDEFLFIRRIGFRLYRSLIRSKRSGLEDVDLLVSLATTRSNDS